MIKIFFSPEGRTQALVSSPVTEQDSKDLVAYINKLGEIKLVYFEPDVDLSKLNLDPSRVIQKPYQTNFFVRGNLALPKVDVEITEVDVNSIEDFDKAVDFLHHSISFDHSQNPPKPKRTLKETRASLQRFVESPNNHTYLVLTQHKHSLVTVGSVSLVELNEYVFLTGVSGFSSDPKPKLEFRRLVYLMSAVESLLRSRFAGKKLVFTSSKDVVIKAYQELGYVIKFDIDGFRLS